MAPLGTIHVKTWTVSLPVRTNGSFANSARISSEVPWCRASPQKGQSGGLVNGPVALRAPVSCNEARKSMWAS
jgi:hypothetical protein